MSIALSLKIKRQELIVWNLVDSEPQFIYKNDFEIGTHYTSVIITLSFIKFRLPHENDKQQNFNTSVEEMWILSCLMKNDEINVNLALYVPTTGQVI